MNLTVKAVVICLALGSSLAVHAEEIAGAFGFLLGQRYTASLGAPESNGMVSINPASRVSIFNKYFVRLVPSTDEISEIEARGTFRSYDECMNMHFNIKTGLKKKYNKKDDSLFGNFAGKITQYTDKFMGTEWNEKRYGHLMFRKGGKKIELTCNSSTLTINYSDTRLNEKAIKEIEANKSRGLGFDSL